MAIRQAHAVWKGTLKEGGGKITFEDSGMEAAYGYVSRFGEQHAGTNPEELIAGAHASCFSMSLAYQLENADHPASNIETTVRVHLTKNKDGFSIPRVELETSVEAPGIDDQTFHQLAGTAKQKCPVSRLLAGAEITLQANLLSAQRA
jgi:osmotically inducible protein OsmC